MCVYIYIYIYIYTHTHLHKYYVSLYDMGSASMTRIPGRTISRESSLRDWFHLRAGFLFLFGYCYGSLCLLFTM